MDRSKLDEQGRADPGKVEEAMAILISACQYDVFRARPDSCATNAPGIVAGWPYRDIWIRRLGNHN
jgi:hypothetical protein